MPSITHSANYILGQLPDDELSLLLNGEDRLEKILLARDAVISHAGENYGHVIFPTANVMSCVVVLDDGRTVASSPIGHEGVVGASLLGRPKPSPMRIVQSIVGDCYRITSARLTELLPATPVLRDLLGRWQETISWLAMRAAACHKHHTVQERMSRWLLELSDRCGNDEFAITQTVLSEMLGANRVQISRIAVNLQRRGYIRYMNGDMQILNRVRLEHLSCTCYAVAQEIYRNVMIRNP